MPEIVISELRAGTHWTELVREDPEAVPHDVGRYTSAQVQTQQRKHVSRRLRELLAPPMQPGDLYIFPAAAWVLKDIGKLWIFGQFHVIGSSRRDISADSLVVFEARIGMSMQQASRKLYSFFFFLVFSCFLILPLACLHLFRTPSTLQKKLIARAGPGLRSKSDVPWGKTHVKVNSRDFYWLGLEYFTL